MPDRQPRFSRRFLTLLIMLTAFAILLLSRMQPETPDDNRSSSQQEQQK